MKKSTFNIMFALYILAGSALGYCLPTDDPKWMGLLLGPLLLICATIEIYALFLVACLTYETAKYFIVGDDE